MRFTVVVPSYNHDAYLAATLDSILSQGYSDVEILVNDGGSSDRTHEILVSYGGQVQWTSAPDRGQTDAINKGLLAATGDIIAYLNSDDVYLPGTLALIADYFAHNPSCDLLYGDAWHLNGDGSIKEPYPTASWCYDKLFHQCFVCQPATFWRRRVMERFGIFDERLQYAMDYEYWLRVGAAAEIHYLAGRPLAGSRLHPDTKTLKMRLPVHREILDVVRRWARRPADCYTWLRHVAALDAEARGFGASTMPDRHRLHRIAYVANVLSLAESLEIAIDESLLDELVLLGALDCNLP